MKKILSGILVAVMVASSMFNISMAADTQTEFTVEAEEIACSGGFTRENGQSSIANVSGGRVLVFDGSYQSAAYTATVNAETAGFYSVNVLANAADGTASDLTFTINGRSVNLTTGSAKTAIADSKGAYGLQLYRFASAGVVYLAKGANELSISVGKRPGYPTSVLATLDAFEFVPSDKLAVSASGKSVIEAEDSIIDLPQAESAGASGGKYVYLESGYSADVTKTASFMAAQEGYYKMNIVAAAAPQNPSSFVNISINGAAAQALHNDQYYSNTATDISGRYGIKLYDFASNQLVYLKEGLNTVTLTIGKRNDVATSMLASFDSFSFEPYTIATVGENAATAVEVEDYNWKHTRTVDGRTSVAFYDAGYASYIVETAVKAETAGNYNMSIEAAVNDGTSTVLGDLALDINSTLISVNNTSFTVSDLGYNYWDAAFPAKSYRKKDFVYLNEGINIIKLTITPNAARGTILAAVDKIAFASARTITDATISVDSVMSKGAEKKISIADQDGISISNIDVYMITYDTSDDDVIIVDGNGKISAVGFGTATVSVAIKTDEDAVEIIKTAEVAVVGDDGIYVNNIRYTNGQLTFDFVSTKNYNATQVFVASFEESDRLKTANLVDVQAGTAGTVTKTASLAGYEDGQTVYILVWQDMKPVWGKVIGK